MQSIISRRHTVAAGAAIFAALSSTSGFAGSAGAATKPGTGKPAVVIGDKNFPEENILGTLYAQALHAKGYSVTVKNNIGDSELTWKALKAGQIGLYPEYTGTLLSAIAGQTKNPSSAAAAYSQAKAFAAKSGFALLNPTPFADSDVLAVKKAFSAKWKVTSVPQLKKFGKKLVLGAPPEFATRYEGLVGLKQAYGVVPTFKPVAIGLSYSALDSGSVAVQNVFTTDPQLLSGKYTLLTDPKGVFGYQNVAPVVSKKVLSKEGPAFASTVNAVSRLLTLKSIQALNKAVEVDKLSVPSVSAKFLKANHLA